MGYLRNRTLASWLLSLCVFVEANVLYAQSEQGQDSLILRTIFLADAGEPSGEFLDLVRTWASQVPKKTTLFFPGDNAYPDGLVGPDSAAAQNGLDALIQTAAFCSVRTVWLAGNHDWGPEYNDLAALENQAEFIRNRLPGALFVPSPGCPGPAQLDLDGVSFLIMDSQMWFMDREIRAPCSPRTREHAIDSLAIMLRNIRNPAVLVAHHPVVSYGKHAGYYTWKEHLFPLTMAAKWAWVPLPVFGSIYIFGKKHLFPSKQDFVSPYYEDYRRGMMRAISTYQGRLPFIFAAGHDHNLQVMMKDSTIHIVSGAGSKGKIYSVKSGLGTLYASSNEGFVLLDMYAANRFAIQVVEVGRDQPVFTLNIPAVAD